MCAIMPPFYSIQLLSESKPHLTVLLTSFWLTRILLEDRSYVSSNSNKAHYWMINQNGKIFEQEVLDKQLYCLLYNQAKFETNGILQTLSEIKVPREEDDKVLNTYELQTYAHGQWWQAAFYIPKKNRMVILKQKPLLPVVTILGMAYTTIENVTATGTCNKGSIRCRQTAENHGG